MVHRRINKKMLKRPITPKERFSVLYGFARMYRFKDGISCPPTNFFICWCGNRGMNPNYSRSSNNFVTKAKETAWLDLFDKEKYFPGWLQYRFENYKYEIASGRSPRR